MRRVLAIAGVAATLAACGPAVPEGLDAADGWTVEVVRDDLAGPSQLVDDGEGGLLVAELAGGEDAGAGRVRDLGPDGTADEPREVVGDLLTPTGLAVDGDTLLVQEQVAVARVAPDGTRATLVDDAPYNGRSQGTLTVTGVDGTVLAVRTGTGSGPDPAPASGELYALLDSGGTPATAVVAVGFKNAYAHAIGPDGALYVTEIGDGTYDGEAPPDELNVVPTDVWRAAVAGEGPPFDGGWPRCTGDADPTEAFGATAEECETLPRPLATFPPRSTPTSVAVTADGRVLVALWVDNRVVEVDPTSGDVTDVVTGLDRPQHLLARPDGTVLLTVHGSGELLRLTPP